MVFRRWWLAVFVALAGSAAFLLLRSASPAGERVVIAGTAAPPVPTLNPDRVAQGAALYVQHCAECHGIDLEGQPGWRQTGADGSLPAPPHDRSGHTWHHPDWLLLDIIADGGDPAFRSNMPGYRGVLTADEMAMILDYLKSRWGRQEREYQWWMTAVGSPQ